MKKWKDYTPPERRMIVVLAVLLVAVVLSWGRIHNGVAKGFNIFYETPVDTINTN